MRVVLEHTCCFTNIQPTMPRIPYVLDPPPSDNADEAALITRIRDRRIRAGHDGLVELDRVLLHAPLVASGWNDFLGAVRTKTSLPDDIRELIICRVAALNGAHYEWGHHAPLLRQALLALPELKSSVVLSDIPGSTKGQWEGDPDGDAARTEMMVESFLEELQQRHDTNWISMSSQQVGWEWVKKFRELIFYVDAMTRSVKVPDEVYKAMRDSLLDGEEGDRKMVEITATCAAYNCVSRFLVAFDVGDKNQ